MTSEGGGKLRQKRNRNSKPYLRPKSVINRVTDAVRSVFNPSWITGLVTWNQAEATEEEAANHHQDEEDDDVVVDSDCQVVGEASGPQVLRPRSALNATAGPSGYVPPSSRLAKPRLPVDGTPPKNVVLNWNDTIPSSGADHLRDNAEPSTSTGGATFPPRSRLTTSTPVNSFLLTSPLLPPDQRSSATDTPFAAAAAFAQRQQQQLRTSTELYSGAPVVQQNGVGSELVQPPRSASSSSAASGSSRFAKLSNIGKLPTGCSNKGKSDQENSRNLGEDGGFHVPSRDGNSCLVMSHVSDSFVGSRSMRHLRRRSFSLAASDSHSECSEESVSTSGCSSMIPHPDKRSYHRDVLQLDKPTLQKLADDLQSTIPSESRGGSDWDRTNQLEDRSSVRSPSFLWTEALGPSSTSRPQPIADSSRPRFNSSLFGTTILPDNSILNGTSGGSSSVKNNKVAYGFGSSYRAKVSALAPYNVSSSRRKQVQAKSVTSGNAEVMSVTAKRILETLEKMNTPLMDAKKIPANRPTDPVLDSPLTFMTSYRRRPCLANKGVSDISRVELSSAGTSRAGPPTRHLHTPGSSAITRTTYLRTCDAGSRPPVEAVASTSRTDSGPAPPVASDSASKSRNEGGGKIKTARRDTNLHYSSKAAAAEEDDDEVSALPNLPSIPLPIKNLPVFNLLPHMTTSMAVPSTSIAAKPAPHHLQQSALKGSQPSSSASNGPETTAATSALTSTNAFSFSSPLANSPFGTPAVPSLRRQEQPKFTFSSPIPVNDAPSPVAVSSALSRSSSAPSVPINFAYEASITTTSSSSIPTAECSPVVVKPKPTVFTSTLSSPGALPTTSRELKSGSVMDVLRRTSASPSVTPSQLKTTGSVMDVLGKMKSPASSSIESATVAPTPLAFGSQFKPAVGTWECSTCMIRNAEDKTKCMACEMPKQSATSKAPAAASSATATTTTATFASSSPSGFGDRFKVAADSWECSTCMVRNDKDKNKCLACETARPGAASVPLTDPTSTLTDRFKMASDMWECDTCLVRNASTAPKCIACESPRPGSAAAITTPSGGTSAFKFGVPSSAASTTPVGSFKFGLSPSTANSLPSGTTTTVTNLFKFGVTPVASVTTKGTDAVLDKEGANIIDAPVVAPSNPPDKAVELGAPISTVASSANITTTESGNEIQFISAPPTKVSAIEKTVTTASITFTPALPTFTFGNNQKSAETTIATSNLFGNSSTVTQASGGFGFKFGAPGTTDAAMPTVTGDTSVVAAPELKFGEGTVTKLNFAAPKPTAATAVEQISAPPAGGGFQFSFGKTEGSVSGSLKRDSSEISGERPQKMAAPASAATGLPAFGSFAPATTPASSGGFVFGSAATAPVAPAPVHPVFGAASADNKQAPSNNFTFSATPSQHALFGAAAAPKSTVGAASPFGSSAVTFGGTQPASSATFGSVTAPGGGFAFGVQPSTTGASTGATPFGALAPASTAFGSSAQSPMFGSGTPAFGTQQQSSQGFSSTFSFGATPNMAFGAAAQPQNGGIFQFSGAQNAAPAQASGPGFGFGQPLVQAQQPPAFSFDPSSPVSLNFTGGLQSASQLPAFSATPNPFDAQQTANRTGRNIKKARRRTQLK